MAYHGTNNIQAATILTNGFIATKGAYSDDQNVIYFTPSIKYCAHEIYAKIYEMMIKETKKVRQNTHRNISRWPFRYA